MASVRLTPRPSVPAWLELAAVAIFATACGDDEDGGSGSNSVTDVAPTAGPCAHDPMSPDCATSSASDTMSTSATMTTDEAPTIPCAHDSDPSDCDTTSPTDPTTGGTSEGSSDSSTGADTSGADTSGSTDGGGSGTAG